MHTIHTHVINSAAPEYAEVFALREEILRRPLGMSLHNEDLSRDHTDDIMVGKADGRVIACLMLHHLDDGQVQLRQMAVYNEWQGKGIGRQLVAAAERYAAGKGYSTMVLHAREVAMGFYRSMGYRQVGDMYHEVGIPHYTMEKDLHASA
ncbi:hypothetical protein GCM10023093_09780 [Nemorincola caseinilytica]|uniref:N-acetyltransferase domain-containing protein n=1 Tax=Nemorincola caseinilytica TaxID=2054315 RepID=A0ABP8N7I2_9BACT